MVLTFVLQQTWWNDEILKSINFLNPTHGDIFNTVHRWAKEYTKRKGANVQPDQIFLSGNADKNIALQL